MKIQLTQKLWDKATDWQTKNYQYMNSYDNKVTIAAGWVKKVDSLTPENFVKSDSCSCMDTKEWSRVFFFRTTNPNTTIWNILVVDDKWYYDTDDNVSFPMDAEEDRGIDIVEEDFEEEIHSLAQDFYQGVCYKYVQGQISNAATVNELGFIYRGISNWESNEGRDDMMALIISKAFTLGAESAVEKINNSIAGDKELQDRISSAWKDEECSDIKCACSCH